MRKKTDFMDRYIKEVRDRKKSISRSSSDHENKEVIIQKETPLSIIAGLMGGLIRGIALSILMILAAVGIIALMLETTRTILISYFTELIRMILAIL